MVQDPGALRLRLGVGCIALFGWATTGFGQIVINEIMYDPNPPAPGNAEWFELYNAGSDPVDLDGWMIRDDATNPQTFTISGTLTIGGGSYLVLGKMTTDHGGITPDYVYPTSFQLANSEDEIMLFDASDTPVEQDRVFYDENPWPVGDGAAIALGSPVDPVTYENFDNNDPGNWCVATTAYGTGALGTPGAANDCPVVEPPPPPLTGEIWEIQGNGETSPQSRGMATTNDNIVTAVISSGFFMQTPTSRSDNDIDTSDGIFVLHGGTPAVMVGDQVDVVGLVEDGPGPPTYEFTRIDATADGGSVAVDASNQPLPAPVEFNETRPSPDPASPSCAVEMECYEGMRVRVVTGTVAAGAQWRSSDPTAETAIVPGSARPYRGPGIAYPGEPGIPVWDGNPEVFEMDPDELGLTNVSWRPRTTFTAIGVLAYSFGDYELYPSQLTLLNPGPALPRPVRAKASGEITVASQNLLNLRGGASASAVRQRGKLSRFIREVLLSPDVIAVQEALGLAALQELATQIQTDDSSVTYTAHVPATGSSQAVGFLVRSGVTVNSVTEHGRNETFVDPRDNSNDPLHDRPPVVLDATAGDFSFSVIGIHNRSLSDVDSATRGDWVRTKRLEQAQSVARLVESMQDSKVVVVGDFNGYQFSDGYVDVVGQMRGVVDPALNLLSGPDLVSKDLCNLVDRLPAEEQYSFLFEGTAQALDHALVNQELERHVVEMQFGRGNADAAGSDRGDATNALGGSDHDGLVVYLSPTAKPAVDPSPYQGEAPAAPPPPPPPPGPTGPGGPSDPTPTADLRLSVDARIVSGDRVRISVTVGNEGPETARNVVVSGTVSLAGEALRGSTSGCEEDPGGVSSCSLGDIAAGEAAAFTIDVETGGASEGSLRYAGSVESDVADPAPGNDDAAVTLPLGPPGAPSDLSATAVGATRVELRRRDNSRGETGFAVFQQGPGDSKPRLIGTAPANATSTIVADLVPGIAYRFAVEARNGSLASERTPAVAATTWFSEEARCDEGDVLCLGSFEVEIAWDAGDGKTGRGAAERLTATSGDFWFFEPDNVEMVVKVLDGCALNGHMWVFAAGLTDLQVTTTVRDLSSGKERVWSSPRGTPFQPILDKEAFASCVAPSGAASGAVAVLSGASPGLLTKSRADSVATAGAAEGGVPETACVASDTALCLRDGRFEVSADWRAGEEGGPGVGFPRTADTGMFWFFSQDNVELIVKVLDGCAVNGHRWVLMGGLTDVVVNLSVTDSVTGEARMYGSPGGAPFEPMFDLEAFSCADGPRG